jgi:peptide/nickel transport system substrate-binding protein
VNVRIAAVVSSLVFVAAAAAACGGNGDGGGGSGSSGGGAAGGMVQRLNMGDFGGGNAPQRNFNPYSPTRLTSDFTFEPLFMINSISCEVTPWLGTEFTWESPSKLIVKTRTGVKWSDGQPFSAKDVEFTFNMLKKSPALDTSGVWSKLASVTADGEDQVTFTFKEPSVPMFNQVGGDVRIVPEHIWSKEPDPAKFTNPQAVGTGPYKVKSQNSQQLVLERNPTYWQADKVKVRELFFKKATGSAEVDKLRLARGEYDWNAMFVPEIEKTFVAKDPEHNHYWFPPGGNIAIYMTLTKAPFNDLQFRKAIAHAIDREEIKNKAQFGYVETASQTTLVLPGQKDLLPPDIPNEGKFPFDAAEAKKILADAGYTTNAEGKLLGKDGKPMTFEFKVQNGWVDWIQAAQIIQKNLAAIGITIDLQTPSPEAIDNDGKIGNFDMIFGVHGGGCNIYQAFQHPFGSSQTAPIGKQAPTNVIRWKDAKTDQLLAELVKTIDEADQKAIVQQLAKHMYEQVPDVTLWYGAQWFQYRTEKVVGWPSEKEPYAGPGNQLLIMTKLRPNPDYKG